MHIGLLSAAVIVEQNNSSENDLKLFKTVFVGPGVAFLTTLGLTYFYRSLGFQPYDRDPRYRYYDRFDDD